MITVTVVRDVDTDALIDRASRDMLNRAMLAVHAAAVQPGIVPIDTGYLRGSLSPGAGVTEVDKGDPPQWARVGTNVPYGDYLNSPQTRTPRYRGGPSSGQETAGWLTERAFQNAKDGVEDAVRKMAADLSGGWKRGD